jgi:hypothetical protein
LLDYDVTLLAKEKVMVEAIQTTASESYHNTVNNHDISPSGVDSQNRQGALQLSCLECLEAFAVRDAVSLRVTASRASSAWPRIEGERGESKAKLTSY